MALSSRLQTLSYQQLPSRLLQTLSYHAQRLSTSSFPQKLLAFLLLSASCTGLGAVVYRSVTGVTWGRAAFTVYGVLYRAPGFTVNHSEFSAGVLVLNCVFLYGLFVFALFIGTINEELKRQLKAVRTVGTLCLQDHLLLLHWTPLTMAVLRHVAAAGRDPEHPFFKRAVVILASTPKATMDTAIAEVLKELPLEVYTREGSPSRLPDLQKAAAGSAGTVILLQPQQASTPAAAEALKATALVSLGRLVQPRQPPRVVVQARQGGSCGDTHYTALLQQALAGKRGALQPLLLQSDGLLRRLVTQTALQPGVATVFREVVAPKDAASAKLVWVTADAPPLTGPCSSLRGRCTGGAILLGVRRHQEAELLLNPDDDLQVQLGDALLLFTQHGPGQCRAAMLQASGTGQQRSLVQLPSRKVTRSISRVSSMSSRQLAAVVGGAARPAQQPQQERAAMPGLPGIGTLDQATTQQQQLQQKQHEVDKHKGWGWSLSTGLRRRLRGQSETCHSLPGPTQQQPGSQPQQSAAGPEAAQCSGSPALNGEQLLSTLGGLGSKAGAPAAIPEEDTTALLLPVDADADGSPTAASGAWSSSSSSTPIREHVGHTALRSPGSGCNGQQPTAGTGRSNGTDPQPQQEAQPRRIIVIGWDAQEVAELCEVLQQQAPPGSHIVVINRGRPSSSASSSSSSSAPKNGKDTAAHGLQQPPAPTRHPSNGAALMSPAAACRGDKLAYPAGSLRDAAAPQQQQQQEEGDADSPGVSPQRCTAEVLEAPGGVGLQVLLTAGLAQAQALVIGSSPELKHEEADAEVVGVLLAVHHALTAQSAAAAEPAAAGTAPNTASTNNSSSSSSSSTPGAGRRRGPGACQLHVVAVLHSYSLRATLRHLLGSQLGACPFSYELIIPQEVTSALLVQVAANPDTADVVHALLLGGAGCALTIVPLSALLGATADTIVTWAQACTAAAQRRQTILGYRRSNGRLLLAPADAQDVQLMPADGMVLLGMPAGSALSL